MTRPTTYELYGCPGCGWRHWRPVGSQGTEPQALHDRERPDCTHNAPLMLVDVAKGGART